MAKEKMINSTKEAETGSVLGSTLEGMDQFDMNVMNDTADQHAFSDPGSNKGKK